MRPLIVLLLAANLAQAAFTPEAAVQAILNNNPEQLRAYLNQNGDPNARTGRENPLLFYAGAYGTLDSVRLLLSHNADPNLQNAFGATSLMASVSDPDKVKLLLEKGADPNLKTKLNRTALLVAAFDANAAQVIDLLAQKGADPAATDKFGYNLVSAGATSGNMAAVRLGLANHLDVNARAKGGTTALINAVTNGSVPLVRLLIDAGADVNATAYKAGPKVKNGVVSMGSYTALIFAAPYASPALTKLLLEHGAKVDPIDDRGMTALHAAVASEADNVETVKLLLAKGADPEFKNSRNESARDWAERFQRPSVLALLGMKPAPLPVPAATKTPISLTPQQAYGNSMALLEKVSGNFMKEGGCVACHAQNATGLASGAGRAKGWAVHAPGTEDRLRVQRLTWAPMAEGLLVRDDPPGAAAAVVSALLGMAGDGYQPDLVTAAMARNVAAQQQQNGSWLRLLAVARVPTEDSAIQLTAEAVHALSHFELGGTHDEYRHRIERARSWLLTAKPTYTADVNFLLLGLKWSGASAAQIAKVAGTLKSAQRPSGGWSQNDNLPEDAYATGQSLYALHEAGMPSSDPAFRKGIDYLLRTQAPDGSWHVVSRSVKFQPYFQSGFPYDHDQWISMSATTWAAMALASL